MKYTNSVAKTVILTLAQAVADSKLYVGDFTIKSGEQLQVALNLDTDLTDVYSLEANITLPAGLSFVRLANGKFIEEDQTRASGKSAQLNNTNGKLSIVDFGKIPFTGSEGAVASFTVEASKLLAETSELKVENVTLRRTNGEKVALDAATAKVTLDPGLQFSFKQTSVSLNAGETASVEVQMVNGTTQVAALQAALSTTEGITVKEVVKADRTPNLQYNAETGVLVVAPTGTISGSEGSVFVVTIEADATFTGSAKLNVSDIVATTAGLTQYDGGSLSIDVTVADSRAKVVFAQSEAYVEQGASVDVDVNLTSEVVFSGMQAQLTLPAGITASVKKGARVSNVLYDAETGMVVIAPTAAFTGTEGAVLTVTLTAQKGLTGDVVAQLTDITLTTADLKTVKPADTQITLKVKDATTKNELLATIAKVQNQLDVAKQTIANYYTAVKDDKAITDQVADIQAQIDALKAQVEADYAANKELDADGVNAKAQALREAIDKLLADAKAANDVATGIGGVKAIEGAVEYYDASGRRIEAPMKGRVTIVKMADGSVKKIVLK